MRGNLQPHTVLTYLNAAFLTQGQRPNLSLFSKHASPEEECLPPVPCHSHAQCWSESCPYNLYSTVKTNTVRLQRGRHGGVGRTDTGTGIKLVEQSKLFFP